MISFPRPYGVPLAVPYWSAATYWAILRSVLFGKIVDGPDLSDLRSLLIQELGVSNVLLCNTGSLALEIALRACDLRPGDEVVIPTFCCTSVVAPILAVGAHPVLADVGEELNITSETLQAALTKKSRAVIVPHLFGNPADIESIIDLARARNIHVIDDAAQALGATIAGRPAGTFGDAGILSFGSDKVCFGLGGGVVVSRQAFVKRSPNVRWQRRNFFLHCGIFYPHCCGGAGGAGRCPCTKRCIAGELQIPNGRRSLIEISPCPTSMQPSLRL